MFRREMGSKRGSLPPKEGDLTCMMHSNDLKSCGKKCCYFWFHSEVKFMVLF